ncbi:MAG: hypothetical protein K6F00_11190 [Lachnospiraceae bacterium]|nr:hypothetical protein [Lachnospiraceae bacterium]
MRALSVEIYKNRRGDCSNNGISSRFNEILIPCETGYIEVDEANPPENLCKVVKRNLFMGEPPYVHIEPWNKAEGAGWMAGGTIVDSCDSRFRREIGIDYPVHLHDRQESWEMNDLLSN